MDSTLVQRLSTDLTNFDAPRVEAILVGIDPTGAHMYVANGGDVTCQDTVSFASIGIGLWHANSQFMFAGHTRLKPFPQTLFLTHSAKKRAEVAPGVGQSTDMFVIGPRLGSYTAIGDHIIKKLEDIYQTTQKRVRKIGRVAEQKVDQYVKEITESATTKSQTAVQEEVEKDKQRESRSDSNSNEDRTEK